MVFALLLLAPAVLAATGHAGFDIAFLVGTEQRQPFLAPPPSSGALATGGWERDGEREIADAFPLRTPLILAYDRVKFAWLRDLPSTRVIAGRDGWFFLGNEERAYITGAYHPSDAELASIADVYARRAAWCRRHGMAYAYLLVPNKSTIYARELPAGMNLVSPTPAERLFPLLRARGVTVIDIRAALETAAAQGEVYSKGDTHWNDAGAYIGYEAVVAAFRASGVRDAIPRSSVVQRVDTDKSDLLNLAGIGSLVPNQIVRYRFPQRAHPVAPPVYPADPNPFMKSATAIDDPSLPTAVVFGDSFTEALRPMLAESFRRMVVLRHYNTTDVQFDPRALEIEKPAVVLDELVERSLAVSAYFKR